MLLLRRHLAPLLRAAPLLPSPIHHRACPLSSTSASASPTAAPFPLEDYLVAVCGLAPAQSRRIAKKSFNATSRENRKAFMEISHWRLNSASNHDCRLKSASNRDAVLSLLSVVGLSIADIAAVVAADPLILRSKPENIGPCLFALRDRFGLSAPQIVRFLLLSSRSLRNRNCDVLPKLQAFISFYGSVELVLLALKRNNRLLDVSLSVIELNIALFRHYGVALNLERLKDILLRAEELGVPRTHQMLRYAVPLIAGNSEEKVAAKLEFLKRILGCSGSETARYFRYI